MDLNELNLRIKHRSVQMVQENILNPTESDFSYAENLMIVGSTLAFQMELEETNAKIKGLKEAR